MNFAPLLSVVAFLLSAVVSAAQSPPVELTEDCFVHFASVEEGKELIVVEGDYLSRMQDAERRIRMQRTEPASKEEFLVSLQDGVKEFAADESERVAKVVTLLNQKMMAYDLPFPKKINLIRVNAEVEFGAPHCRGASVILPDSFFGSEKQMSKILAHEFFHVLSSHNPKLRDRLYALIGFQPCNEVELPPSLIKRRLTNPDAPIHQHVIRLKAGDETLDALPVTFLNSTRYRGGGLMSYLRFQLLVVEKKGDKFLPKIENEQHVLLPMDRSTNYMAKIGRNTHYIIHPEETLADNFWMMVLNSPKIQDRWVIDGMEDVLRRSEAK